MINTMLVVRAVTLLAVACILAGCGSRTTAPTTTAPTKVTWTRAQCAREAGWIVGHARQILRYYNHENGDIYPADVSFLDFRDSVARFRQFGCRPPVLGTALRRALTASQRAELLEHLSPQIARYVREALAA